MPVLPQYQPGQAVDTRTASNVFDDLQRSRAQAKIVELETADLASRVAFNAATQDTRMKTEEAKLHAAQIQLSSAANSADQTLKAHRKVRELQGSWNPDEFLGALDGISEQGDILDRRKRLAETVAQYSRFAAVPEARAFMEPLVAELGGRLDQELAHKVETGNLELFQDRKSAEANARGRRVSQIVSPFSSGPSYTISDDPDPSQDSRATAMINRAMLRGDMAALDAVEQDEMAGNMINMPGSNASKAFATAFKAIQSAEAAAAKAEKADASENRELSVPGYTGAARTKEEAVAFRENLTTTNNVIRTLQEITDIAAEPGAITNLKTRAIIKNKQSLLVGMLRIPLTGPGAMTDAEREFIIGTIGNPVKVFAFESVEKAKLKTVIHQLEGNLAEGAGAIGLVPDGESDTVRDGGLFDALQAERARRGL